MPDERWIRSLHVETLCEEEPHAEREPHVLFQASTIGALLDGRFESVRARSVPRQQPPYRPLTEVVAEQHVFELTDPELTAAPTTPSSGSSATVDRRAGQRAVQQRR